jgi:hypothetical protein
MDTIPPVFYCIADMHLDALSIADLAVNFAVFWNGFSEVSAEI